MPCLLKALSSIAPSDAAYAVDERAQESRATGERRSLGCGRDELGEHVVRRRCDGSVDRRLRAGAPLEQIRPMLLRPDRVDRVVHGALHHAHVDLERGWRTAVRRRERAERARRDLVPVGHLTGVGPVGGAAETLTAPSAPRSAPTATGMNATDRLRDIVLLLVASAWVGRVMASSFAPPGTGRDQR